MRRKHSGMAPDLWHGDKSPEVRIMQESKFAGKCKQFRQALLVWRCLQGVQVEICPVGRI